MNFLINLVITEAIKLLFSDIIKDFSLIVDEALDIR